MDEPSGARISIPGDDDPWWGVVDRFAMTFDAYERVGSFNKVSRIANLARTRFDETGTLPNEVDRLRTCLFFEQRRWRHLDDDLYTHPSNKAYIQAILSKLRMLTGGFVEGPGDRWP